MTSTVRLAGSRRTFRHFSLVVTLIGLLCVGSRAATIVVVSASNTASPAKMQAELAARYYGLQVVNIALTNSSAHRFAFAELNRPDTIAVLLTYDGAALLDHGEMAKLLLRAKHLQIPVALVGISGNNPGVLQRWSARAIDDCASVDEQRTDWELSFSADGGISQELMGAKLPFAGHVTCGMHLNANSGATVLMTATGNGNDVPLFARVKINRQEIFFSSGLSPSSGGERMSALLPMLMLIRYAAGDQAWHTPGEFANLTIDDAWLTGPFGNLNYTSLLQQMQQHNFHTTIAFIPWNFDRNRGDVVELFRKNADRFSICVHGNNHDHQEFGPYSDSPLSAQTANAVQALARMEQFTRITGIPYSPVMVFPHSVAPLQTFKILKRDNYWATANSQNIPLGSAAPEDALFSLRPMTLEFGNFLSFKRYSAEVPLHRDLMQMEAFLGNPILFYGHQQLFHDSIGAFDSTADFINRVQPNTKWLSLGEIVQHCYLLRRTGAAAFDVFSFSPDFVLTNQDSRTLTFAIRKPEDFAVPIHSVTVDGQVLPYHRENAEIAFEVAVKPNQTRHISVSYANGINLASIDVEKKQLSVKVLRELSDFRDMTLTKSDLGFSLTTAYYRWGADSLELVLERSWMPMVLFFGTSSVIFRIFQRKLGSGKRSRST